VINATGVILHTNLGRAPLSAEAAEAMKNAAVNYSALEYDIEHGNRGSRHALLAPLLSLLTGAEDGLVVNNNAAALAATLAAVARGREVIVSRGQAVEIGGGFRIPEILRMSGAKLVEVGTTNRTRLSDYAAAITPRTAALLHVHPSNFKIIGFTESVELGDLTALGHGHGIPVIDDVGSGCLLDITKFGVAPEPLVQDRVRSGADVVCFSGDKLLGGPQCGILVGRAASISRVRQYPLARAVRVDKITLAALHATLLHYLRGEALDKIPVWQMIAAPIEAMSSRAMAWMRAIAGVPGYEFGVCEGRSMIGGGSTPGESVPTYLLSVRALQGGRGWASRVAAAARQSPMPVLARVEEGTLLLDPRTVLPWQDAAVASCLARVLRGSADPLG
jgi:L-seryl-tRNA(Ser) seleniumtransferase